MRFLAAILIADVVGYSKMMSFDEEGTLTTLRSFNNEVISPALTEYEGKLIKSLGDGWLIEFRSNNNAVSFAKKLQSVLKTHKSIKLRIGIHSGDVEHENDDVFGDVVNVAARLESIGEPGGIAVSSSTYLSLDQHNAAEFKNAGHQSLKNIATPVEVWSTGRINISSKGLNPSELDGLTLCVVPFADSDNFHVLTELADNLTEDMARLMNAKQWLNSLVQSSPGDSMFQLHGAVKGEGSRVRIEVLLKAPGGKTLWTGRFAGNSNQISLWKDSVGEQIAQQLFIEIMKVRSRYEKK